MDSWWLYRYSFVVPLASNRIATLCSSAGVTELQVHVIIAAFYPRVLHFCIKRVR